MPLITPWQITDERRRRPEVREEGDERPHAHRSTLTAGGQPQHRIDQPVHVVRVGLDRRLDAASRAAASEVTGPIEPRASATGRPASSASTTLATVDDEVKVTGRPARPRRPPARAPCGTGAATSTCAPARASPREARPARPRRSRPAPARRRRRRAPARAPPRRPASGTTSATMPRSRSAAAVARPDGRDRHPGEHAHVARQQRARRRSRWSRRPRRRRRASGGSNGELLDARSPAPRTTSAPSSASRAASPLACGRARVTATRRAEQRPPLEPGQPLVQRGDRAHQP